MNANNHVGTLSDWQCDEQTDKHYKVYSVCQHKVNEGTHTGGTATCKSQAVCEDCGQPYGTTDSANHERSLDTSTWERSADKHWHMYPCCGATADVEAHDFTYDPATCIKRAKCKCDETSSTTDPDNHEKYLNTRIWYKSDDKHWHEYLCCGAHADEEAHDFTYSPATCTEPAKCKCGKTSGTALGHSFTTKDSGIKVSDATCTQKQKNKVQCDNCSAVSDTVTVEVGEPLGHTYIKDNGYYNVLWDWKNYDTKTEKGYVDVTFICTRKDSEGNYCDNGDGKMIVNKTVTESEIKKDVIPGTCQEQSETVYIASVDFDGKTHISKAGVFGDKDPDKHVGTLSDWQCDEQTGKHYKVYSVCGHRVNEGEHTGGTATCKSLAECTVCQNPYGETDPNNHEQSLDTSKWYTSGGKHWHEYPCCNTHADDEAHDYTYSPATCTGSATCKCGKIGGAPLGHKYTDANGDYNVSWDWSNYDTVNGTGEVTATFTCTRANCDDGDHNKVVTKTATGTDIQKTTTPSNSCTVKGTVTFTATVQFDGKSHTGTKTVDGEYGAHSFTNKDSGIKASDATCTQKQKNKVQCDNCSAVSDTVTVEVGEPLGHKYTDDNGDYNVSWDWSNYNTVNGTGKVTATFTCTRANCDDGDHNKVVTKTATVQKDKTPGTCQDKEKTVFTATVNFDGTDHTDTETTYGATNANNHVGTLSDWQCDEQTGKHYKVYSVCGHRVNEGTHTGGTATCKKQAVCTVCQNPYGEKDSNNHESVLGTEWKQGESKHWHEYNCCGAHADEEAHDFTYSPATCTEPAKCKCGKTSGTALGHNYGDPVWNWTGVTSATATFTCGNDASHVETRTDNQIESRVKTPATYEEMGWTEYTAEVTLNGNTYTTTKDVQDIPKKIRTLTHEPANDPTCNEPGNREYWYGKDENGNTHYYLDKDGDTETTLEAVTIPKLEHQFTDYVSNDDATCTDDGTKTAYCDHGCGATDTIPDPNSADCERQIIVIDGTSYEYCGRCGQIDGKDLLTEIQNETLPNGYEIIIRFGTLPPKKQNAMFITVVDQSGEPVDYFGNWDVLVPIEKLKQILGIPAEQEHTFTLGAVDTTTGKTDEMKVEVVDGKLKFKVDFSGEDTFVVLFK